MAWAWPAACPAPAGTLGWAWGLPAVGIVRRFRGVARLRLDDAQGDGGGGRAPAAVSAMNPRRLRWTDRSELSGGLLHLGSARLVVGTITHEALMAA